MRAIRLVITVGAELGVFFSLVLFARSGLWLFFNSFGTPIVSNTGKWYMDYSTNYPIPSMVAWAVAFSLAWVTMYAVGMPYRNQSDKPGLTARRCHRCRIAIPDDFKCSNCRAFRPQKLMSMFLQFLSKIVSWLFLAHDVSLGILSLVLGKK
jgi:hypothetical protein